MFGAAALLESLVIFFQSSDAVHLRVHLTTVVGYVVGEVLKSLFQIDQTMDQGFHVCPVILPVTLPLCLHPIDMLVENLPWGTRVPIRPCLCWAHATHTP